MPISWGGNHCAVNSATMDYGMCWQPLEILMQEFVVYDVCHAMRGEEKKTNKKKLGGGEI